MRKQAQQVSGDRCRTEWRQDGQRSISAQQPSCAHRHASSAPLVSHTSRSQTGFTVLELMVAMTIAAVLFGIGAPAFNGFVTQQRLTAETNSFVGAIAYARSESTRRRGTVSLQARGTDNANEWGEGYCVVVGTPGDCAGDAGTEVLRIYDPAQLASMNGQGALNGLSTLSFNGRGMFTFGATGQIDLCSNDTLEDPGRQLDISVIGRLNVSQLDCPD